MVLVALPAAELKPTYVFTNPHPEIGNLFAEFVIDPETFRHEIAPARTLAFTRDIEAMRSQGLAMGGDLDAVVVIDESGYVNERRFPDEVVRHKVLDLLGDLALLGPLKAHVVGVRSGHAANAALSKRILEATRVATGG
jgi:UDP-3-O-[3-hydroxymyristoyl] N-acetylglucosamine deacetylase